MTVYPVQIIPPNTRLQLVDPKTGILTVPGNQFLQQLWSAIVGANQVLPCTAENTSNLYTLTTFPTPPNTDTIQNYSDYMVFSFVSPFTSTGVVTANVNGLGTVKVYKTNGAAQATVGDIVANSLYLLIYNSNLDSSNGGLVLK